MTRRPHSALGYFGGCFDVGRADFDTRNHDSTVLDDPENNWPVMQSPWTGEDPQRQWVPSAALKALRKRLKENQ